MSPRTKPLILLANDDGFFSGGMEALHSRLKDLADVFIVAPDREKSATSLSLTLRRPLRVQKIRERIYAVDGTPADCIYLAVRKLLPRKPALLISGINHGPNLGQQDISYSGTVAAAIQGTYLRVPSLAVSMLADGRGRYRFDFGAGIVRLAAEYLLEHRLPRGITLNMNIPAPPVKGIKITKLGEKRYSPQIIRKKDPRNNFYYWIGTGRPRAVGDKETDVRATRDGYISVTPLHTDLTDYRLVANSYLTKFTLSLKNETE